MKTTTITSANFQKEVLEAKVPVLLDFWAQWCGPCRMVAPLMDELAIETDGKAVIGKVNVDEEMELAQKFGIMSIPTIMIFNEGKQKNKVIGARGKSELRNLLGI